MVPAEGGEGREKKRKPKSFHGLIGGKKKSELYVEGRKDVISREGERGGTYSSFCGEKREEVAGLERPKGKKVIAKACPSDKKREKKGRAANYAKKEGKRVVRTDRRNC